MPYTYIITHIESNVKYYGVQYKKTSNPNDLGVTYFSSSKVLKKLIKEEGVDKFKFEVRKIFIDKHKAIEWEKRFLTRIDAANSPMWFNLSNSGAVNPGGYKLSLITRLKMSKEKSIEHKEKLKKHLEKNRKIPEWTDERKKQWSNRMMKNKINSGRKQKQRSAIHCEKISNFLIGNTNGSGKHDLKKVVCPHCLKEGSGPNMTRYHFSNCKSIN
jgi:ribosomal protein L39E